MDTLHNSIVYVYEDSPDEYILPLLEQTDIACFSIHKDVEDLSPGLYVTTRGVMTSYDGIVNNRSTAYIIDRLPDLYIQTQHAPSSRPHRLINGAPELDDIAIYWCLHHSILSCFDVDHGPLEINGVIWDGNNPDEWIRSQLVPPLIDLNHLESTELIFTGIALHKTYIYIVTEKNYEEVEKIVDTFYKETDKRYLITMSNQIKTLQVLFPSIEMPGVIIVSAQNETHAVNNTLNGEIDVQVLHRITENIVAGI